MKEFGPSDNGHPFFKKSVSLKDLGRGMEKLLQWQHMADKVGWNILEGTSRFTPESLKRKMAAERAFLTVKGLIGTGGIHCPAYCAFLREQQVSPNDLAFWQQEKTPATSEIETHLRALPVLTRDNYYLRFAPEHRFPGNVDSIPEQDMVIVSSSSSSGQPAVVLRSKAQIERDQESLELQLLSLLPRGERRICVRLLYAAPGVAWGPGVAMKILLDALARSGKRMDVTAIEHVEVRECAEEIVQAILEDKKSFPHTMLYAFVDRTMELFYEVFRLIQGRPDQKAILDVVREKVSIASTGMPFEVPRRIRLLEMLAVQTPGLEAMRGQQIGDSEASGLCAFANFTRDSFGATEYNTGFSGSHLTNLILLAMENFYRELPDKYRAFCQRWFGLDKSPPALVEAANPSLYIYTGSWKNGTPTTEPGHGVGPGFGVSATGGVVNVHVGDEYALTSQSLFLEELQKATGIDLRKLMRRIGIKWGGAAPLLWITGRKDAVYFDGQQVFLGDVWRGLEGTELFLQPDFVLQESRQGGHGGINLFLCQKGDRDLPPRTIERVIEGVLSKNEQLQHKLRAFLGVPLDSEHMPTVLAEHPYISEYLRLQVLPEAEFVARFREHGGLKTKQIWPPEEVQERGKKEG